jgi:hypothetical protein
MTKKVVWCLCAFRAPLGISTFKLEGMKIRVIVGVITTAFPKLLYSWRDPVYHSRNKTTGENTEVELIVFQTDI